MTQEDIQLLADLCARLPYGVKVLIPECRQDIATLIGADDKCFAVKYGSTFYCPFHISIKPYLRPISSMTVKEKNEFEEILEGYDESNNPFDGFLFGSDTDWLNRHYFDYRGLIEKGLALEAPEGMYRIEE